MLFRDIPHARADPHREPGVAEVASDRDLHRRDSSDRVSSRDEDRHHAVTLVLHDLTATTLNRFGQQPIVQPTTHIERLIAETLTKRGRTHQIREHDRARTRTHNPSMHHRPTTASGAPPPSRTNMHGEKGRRRAPRIARSELSKTATYPLSKRCAQRLARCPGMKSQAAPLGGFEPPAFGLEGLQHRALCSTGSSQAVAERHSASYPLSHHGRRRSRSGSPTHQTVALPQRSAILDVPVGAR